MKRVCAVAALVMALLAGSTYGVTQKAGGSGRLAKGFKMGLNMAKFTGSNATIASISPGFRTGFVAGGFVRFDVSQTVGLQFEGLYAMKGSTYSAGGSTGTFRFDYIEIPALLAFRFPGSSSVTPGFAFGPAVAFKMSSKYSEAGITVESSALGFPVKSTDFGLIFGGGLSVKSGAGEVLFDLRYELGLTKWYDYAITPDLKNSALTFMIGYAF